jgi:predicted GNAT family acetyltransferase
MTTAEFCATHMPVLEQDEARHMMMLGVLTSTTSAQSAGVQTWTLGQAGQCAIMRPGGQILLADLDERQCHAFAEATADLDYSGVIGPEQTAIWFMRRARELGAEFLEPMPQRIHSLSERPIYPAAAGYGRKATSRDVDILENWLASFVREASPHEAAPSRESVEKGVASGRYFVWMVGEQLVSTAAIVRRTRHSGGIAAVFTPSGLRGKGYAGAVTAAVVEHLFDEGKTFSCLNTDLRNPSSNRCYARIGFKPVCDTVFFPRRR